jgi:hypothetical protein
MELTLVDSLIPSSTTNSELLSSHSDHKGLPVRYDAITYRDHEIEFLSDPAGVQCFGKCNDWLVDLGLNNMYYKEDMCRFIDRQLDLITDFRDSPNFVGAKLEYFHNGDYRDIRLSYKGRILKIFLVAGVVNETWIISESQKILINSGLLELENNL